MRGPSNSSVVSMKGVIGSGCSNKRVAGVSIMASTTFLCQLTVPTILNAQPLFQIENGKKLTHSHIN